MGLTNVTLFPKHFYSVNNIFQNTKSQQFGPARKQQQHMDAEVATAVTLLNLPKDSDSVVETLTLSMIICNNVSSHKTSFSQLLASSPKEIV